MSVFIIIIKKTENKVKLEIAISKSKGTYLAFLMLMILDSSLEMQIN
jgi:hypothetical protein